MFLETALVISVVQEHGTVQAAICMTSA